MKKSIPPFLLLVTLGLTALTASAALQPQNVDALVTPYLKVQAAFAADDLPTAQTATKGLVAAAGEHTELSELQKAASQILETDHLEKARAAFLPVSKEMQRLLETVGASREEPLYVAFCPMALGYSGGTWIQDGETVMNPYEGSRMLHCGTIQKTITKSGE